MITILTIIGVLILGYLIFTNSYPSFGGDVSKERQLVYQQSQQFKDGKFNNTDTSAPQERSFTETLGLAYTFFTAKVPNGRPKEDLKVNKIDSAAVARYEGRRILIWYGHSAFLLQIGGKMLLIDPMFGKVPAPHPWLGSNRFNSKFPLESDQLPEIDAVVFSHDHYDHLNYESVIKLKNKTRHFFVPSGLACI